MRNFLKGFAVAVVVLVASVATAELITGYDANRGVVSMEVFKGAGVGDTGSARVAKKGKVLYDSGVVAAGGAITSTLLDTTGIEQLEVFADNSAGAATRNFGYILYLDDGTTVIDTWGSVHTCAIGTLCRYQVGWNATSVNTTAALSIALPTKMKITFAAGGAANGRVWVWGR